MNDLQVPAADLRVSDAERDAVVAQLSQHFQAGRLDQTEFDERMASALRARVGRDLSTLLKDLPSLREPREAPARRAGPPRLVMVLAPMMFAAFLLSAFASGGGPQGPHRDGPPWVVFPLFWLVVITVARVGWWRRSRRVSSGAEVL